MVRAVSVIEMNGKTPTVGVKKPPATKEDY